MKRILLLLAILASCLSSSRLLAQEKAAEAGSESAIELTETDKKMIRQRIARIGEKDQQFRVYLSFGTTDEKEIAEIQKRDAQGQLQAMAQNKGSLSAEVKSLFIQLQRKNDKENYVEFVELVSQYGYPSPERIGVKTDGLFALLLHPHVDLDDIENHMTCVCELLMPEVKAGRFEAKKYALFVDNMLCKILGRPQLYGTNQVYDSASGKVLPPAIESIEAANNARQKIGLPILEVGEYRITPSSK